MSETTNENAIANNTANYDVLLRESVLDYLTGTARLGINPNPTLKTFFRKGAVKKIPLAKFGKYYETRVILGGSSASVVNFDGEGMSEDTGELAILTKFFASTIAQKFTINRADQFARKSDNEKIEILKEKITRPHFNVFNKQEVMIYGASTDENGLNISGLSEIISKTPGVTPAGGIDPALYPQWQNLAFNIMDKDTGLSGAGNDFTDDNILDFMGDAIDRYESKTGVSDRSNCVLFVSSEIYSMLRRALENKNNLQVIAQSVSEGKWGYESIVLRGTEVVNVGALKETNNPEQGDLTGITPKTAYLVNFDYLYLGYFEEPTKASDNQDVSGSLDDINELKGLVSVYSLDGNTLVRKNGANDFKAEGNVVSTIVMVCTDRTKHMVLFSDDGNTPQPEVLTIKADKTTYVDGTTGTLTTSSADASVSVDNATNVTNLVQDGTTKTKWTFKALGDAKEDKTAKFTVAKEGATSGSVSVTVSKKAKKLVITSSAPTVKDGEKITATVTYSDGSDVTGVAITADVPASLTVGAIQVAGDKKSATVECTGVGTDADVAVTLTGKLGADTAIVKVTVSKKA